MTREPRRFRCRGAHVAVLLAAVALAACGSPSDADPRSPASAAPGTSAAPSEATVPAAPERPARIAARAAPSVERCIEERIHSPEFDRMSPRDARRRLVRLQVKADCEERLAAR